MITENTIRGTFKGDRRQFIGGSGARIIMSADEAVFIRQ